MKNKTVSFQLHVLNHFTFFILCYVFMFQACKPPVTFDKPQPEGIDSLLRFPKRMQGKYLSLSDNSVLTISQDKITRFYDYDVKMPANQLNSLQGLNGDTLTDLRTHEKTVVKVEADTIIRHVNYTDTLFSISETNVLKKFKGYCFINILYNKASWEVKKLHLYDGRLMISSISSVREIELIESITESRQDTVSRNFSLTRKQFKTLINSNGFSNSETFVRMK